jgi:hypothetical protein
VSDGTAPEGIELALKLCRKYKTRRCEKLERLEAYGNGTQYDGRPQFLEPADDVPLLDRAPCIVYPAVEIAIAQHIDFAFGEGRFPKISTGVSEDDSKIDDLLALNEEDSATFDAFLLKLIDVTNFHAASDEALESGEMIGSAISIVRADNGMLGFETVDAKYATPAYDPATRELVSITIEYPFVYEWIDPAGKAHAKCQIYRRVIDQIADVVFEPVDALESGAPVISTKEQARVDHKLGFCPVVWWPRKRGCKKQGVIDGHAIHEKLTDEMDAVNFELSQRFRAMLVSGDPQIYEIGVNKGEQVAPVAAPRASVMVDSQTGHGYFGFTERPRSSRRKGAGIVWRYENVEAKVGMLTIPPGVLKEMGDVAKDDIEILSQSLGYTRLETQGVRGAMSGKALAFLFVRTTAFVDKERRDIWDGWMAPSISMLARVGFTLASRGETLFVPGLSKVLSILARCQKTTTKGTTLWLFPFMRPTWGPYFEPTGDDELQTVNASSIAYDKGLITRVLAVEKLRSVFAFESAQAVVDAIEEEQAEKQKRAMETAQAMAKTNGVANEPDGDEPPAKKPPNEKSGTNAPPVR